MLQVVVVMLERAFGVVRWVDEDALDLPAIERQQGFQRFKVIALNQQVVLGWRERGHSCGSFWGIGLID